MSAYLPLYDSAEDNDRLAELQQGSVVPANTPSSSSDADAAIYSSIMGPFFEDVELLKSAMALVRSNLQQIDRLHGERLTAISSERDRSSAERLDQLMTNTNQVVTSVRDRLKQMDEANKEFAEDAKHLSEARIRTTQHGSLTRSFIALVAKLQELQTTHKDRLRARNVRQYLMVNPEATAAEVDEAFSGEQAGAAAAVFTTQLMQGAGFAAARIALAEIEERHRDITRLEASLSELHQLFLDMAVLAEAQGELLEQIEYSVAQAALNTGGAVEELRIANQLQKAKRRRMCCLVCVGMIILVVLLVPMVASWAYGD